MNIDQLIKLKWKSLKLDSDRSLKRKKIVKNEQNQMVETTVPHAYIGKVKNSSQNINIAQRK